MGGLGNQMFQYAAGRALALQHSVPLKLDLNVLLDRSPRKGFVYRTFDLDMFNITAEIAAKSEIPFAHRLRWSGHLRVWHDNIRGRAWPNPGRETRFQYNDLPRKVGASAYLDGFWQSPRYFADCAEAIRKEFTLKQDVPDNVRELGADLSASESICVNVRRGDFVGSQFHCTLGQDYYDAALQAIAARISKPHIYVFSDDIEWCKNNLRFQHKTCMLDHHWAGPRFSHYLHLMKACHAFVIPNSTFAWWAAWLSPDPNKVVVAPKRWFLDESIDTSDLIPPSWIRI